MPSTHYLRFKSNRGVRWVGRVGHWKPIALGISPNTDHAALRRPLWRPAGADVVVPSGSPAVSGGWDDPRSRAIDSRDKLPPEESFEGVELDDSGG
ncbi:hypothetical protein EYZ11_005694 [Aspergillus tanneri]|uniref:Uncharacterized protein n=1 Tax=Aspergillus tanneri TaxID=1220188 RepID=A0A4S3JHL2_9EURO|nr:hypothetical protein EYZ11_005694 [Aspergillus tanneri]